MSLPSFPFSSATTYKLVSCLSCTKNRWSSLRRFDHLLYYVHRCTLYLITTFSSDQVSPSKYKLECRKAQNNLFIYPALLAPTNLSYTYIHIPHPFHCISKSPRLSQIRSFSACIKQWRSLQHVLFSAKNQTQNPK